MEVWSRSLCNGSSYPGTRAGDLGGQKDPGRSPSLFGKEVRRSQQPQIHSSNPRPTQNPTQPIPPEALPPGGRRTSENEVASQSGVVETPEQAAFLID